MNDIEPVAPAHAPLAADRLRHACEVERLPFRSTAELEPIPVKFGIEWCMD